MVHTYPSLIKSVDALITKLEERGKRDRASFYANQLFYQAYYDFNKPIWKQEYSQPYKLEIEKQLYSFYKRRKELMDEMKEEEKIKLLKEVRNIAIDRGMQMEVFTFYQWMAHLVKDCDTNDKTV